MNNYVDQLQMQNQIDLLSSMYYKRNILLFGISTFLIPVWYFLILYSGKIMFATNNSLNIMLSLLLLLITLVLSEFSILNILSISARIRAQRKLLHLQINKEIMINKRILEEIPIFTMKYLNCGLIYINFLLFPGLYIYLEEYFWYFIGSIIFFTLVIFKIKVSDDTLFSIFIKNRKKSAIQRYSIMQDLLEPVFIDPKFLLGASKQESLDIEIESLKIQQELVEIIHPELRDFDLHTWKSYPIKLSVDSNPKIKVEIYNPKRTDLTPLMIS